MIARLHPCAVGTVEIRRVGAANNQWQARVYYGRRRIGGQWRPERYSRAFDALYYTAQREGFDMKAFYGEARPCATS